jgi:hypothetical protein
MAGVQGRSVEGRLVTYLLVEEEIEANDMDCAGVLNDRHNLPPWFNKKSETRPERDAAAV